MLTAFNGKAITYDTIGNPLHWYDGTDFKWVNGKQLASAVNKGKDLEASYTYNVDGLRMSKTVNGVEHKYIWQGDRLLSESYGDTELEFFYDESGKPYSMSYKADANAEPVMYYYVTNLQGDIMSMVDAEGFSVAEYYYNAWGLPMGTLGALAEINPLRYRGYYFDTETGLYYLKVRYYDPFVCRFINADNYQSTGQDILGTNMFAYCDNNPVNREDTEGEFFNTIFGTIVGGIAAVVTRDKENESWQQALVRGAVTGAASGFALDVGITLAGTGVGLAVAVVGGAFASGFDSIWEHNNRNVDIDWGNVAIDTAVGGIFNGIFCGFGRVQGRATGKTVKEAVKAVKTNFVNDITTVKGAFHFGKFLRNSGINFSGAVVQTGFSKIFSAGFKKQRRNFESYIWM